MKGYRFYAELPVVPDGRKTKAGRKGNPSFTRKNLRDGLFGPHVNVVAVMLDENQRPMWQGSSDGMDAVAAATNVRNAGVIACSVSRCYLRDRCVRIDEALARRIHPNLFMYLED